MQARPRSSSALSSLARACRLVLPSDCPAAGPGPAAATTVLLDGWSGCLAALRHHPGPEGHSSRPSREIVQSQAGHVAPLPRAPSTPAYSCGVQGWARARRAEPAAGQAPVRPAQWSLPAGEGGFTACCLGLSLRAPGWNGERIGKRVPSQSPRAAAMTLTAATPCGWLLARDWLKCVTNTSLFDSCRNNGKHRRSGGRELEPASCSALRKHGILQSPVLQMRSLSPREVQPAPVPPKARRRPAGCRLASTLPTPAPEAPPLPRPLGSRLQPPLTSRGRDHVSPSLLLASQARGHPGSLRGPGVPAT